MKKIIIILFAIFSNSTPLLKDNFIAADKNLELNYVSPSFIIHKIIREHSQNPLPVVQELARKTLLWKVVGVQVISSNSYKAPVLKNK